MTSAKVKAGSIGPTKLSAAAKSTLKGAPGAPGAPGAKGDKGDQGPATGPAGGALSGTYPNPGLADGSVTPAKVGAVPTVAVRTTVAQSIPNGLSTFTPITFDTELYDVGDLHAAGSDSFTAPIAGVYAVSYTINFDPNAIGSRVGALSTPALNPLFSPFSISIPAVNGTTTRVSAAAQLRLSAGEAVQLNASQNSGAALTTNSIFTTLQMTWIAP